RITGEAAARDRSTANEHTNILSRTLGYENTKVYTDLEGNSHVRAPEFETYKGDPREASVSRVGDVAEDLLGGLEENSRPKRLLDRLVSSPHAKKASMIGGLALAGFAAINVLRHKDPIEDPKQKEQASIKPPPTPRLDMNTNMSNQSQNANINISAEGQRVSQEQLSTMVQEGMTRSNMNTGPSRVSIDYNDNTSQLNDIWYRDKIEENMR